MPSTEFDRDTQLRLLQLARDSINHGLQKGFPLKVNPSDYPAELQQEGASFVTLHKHGDLRGCIGTLQAYQPLVTDIANHAFDAAFKDPRFPPLHQDELPQLHIDISVLGKPEPIHFTDEQDLLSQIRPGTDGLILEYGYNRGTFLPSVWEQLPTVTEFFNHLKLKAGLPVSWWSNDATVSRYQTFNFEE